MTPAVGASMRYRPRRDFGGGAAGKDIVMDLEAHTLLDDIGIYLYQWMKVEISGLLLSLFADTFNS